MSTTTTAANAPTHEGALIFLHGLGGSPAGWKGLQRALPQYRPRLNQIKYVFPSAPTIPISINGDREMRGWFDVYEWPIAVGAKDDLVGLRRSVAQIQEVVAKLGIEDGIPPHKIVIGGFSQGGAVALLTCYHPTIGMMASSGAVDGRPLYAGCVGMSAWLTLPDEVAAESDEMEPRPQQTPLFWGHGRHDNKVLFPQQAFGVEKLEQIGVDVTARVYPMGHTSHPKEKQELALFLDHAIFGPDEESPMELKPNEASARSDL